MTFLLNLLHHVVNIDQSSELATKSYFDSNLSDLCFILFMNTLLEPHTRKLFALSSNGIDTALNKLLDTSHTHRLQLDLTLLSCH